MRYYFGIRIAVEAALLISGDMLPATVPSNEAFTNERLLILKFKPKIEKNLCLPELHTKKTLYRARYLHF